MILWMSKRHGAATEEILQRREVEKRTTGTGGKTDRVVEDHSQCKSICKTLQNFLWSDCFQVQLQLQLPHMPHTLDKASLVCQGVRREEWEGGIFYFFFILNLLLLKHAAATGFPRVLAPGLSVNLEKSLPVSTLFLLRPQPGTRCTFSSLDSCQCENDIYQFPQD